MRKLTLLFLFFLAGSGFGLAQTPAYLSEPWIPTGGPIGGLGYDIRYAFDNHDRWYVTDGWSGFYISEDRGVTWRSSNSGITATKGLDAIPIFCCTVDPHNPSTLWIGTEGTGDIYRSTDAGETWESRSNGVEKKNNAVTFRGFTVHPQTPDIVYAMAEIGSAAWTVDGHTEAGPSGLDKTMGVVYKTENGGEDWVEIWRGNNLTRYCCINPDDPNIIYVSTGIFDRDAANAEAPPGFAGGVGVLKSTDGGATWTVFDRDNGLDDLYISTLAMHPTDPETLLAATGHDFFSGENLTGGLFMSTNGGEQWTRVLPGPGAPHETIIVVEYSTVNPEIVYAFSGAAAYRSDNGGVDWVRFSREQGNWGPPGLVVGFPIDAQCDPMDPMRVIVNNYLGGNVVSEDGGETWMEASLGYTGALVRFLSVDPACSGHVFTGSRSGVYRSTIGGDVWQGLINKPMGMPAKFNEIIGLAVDPDNPAHMLTVPGDYRTVLVSEDGGQSWEIGSQVGGTTALEFAPSGPFRAYAASDQGFYRSDNGGHTFDLVNAEAIGMQITALVVHPTNMDQLWAMTEELGFVTSSDGGQTWNQQGTGLPDMSGTCLAVHPLDLDLMFTAMQDDEAMGGEGLFRSQDGGQTWDRMTAGLEPNAEIYDIVVDPTNMDILYCCDHFSGVYVSTDRGSSWTTVNEGLNHKTVNVLAISADGAVLYAGIEGAGVYRLGEPQSLRVDIPQTLTDPMVMHSIYPNPFSDEVTIRMELNNDMPLRVDIIDLQGQTVCTLLSSHQPSGSLELTWNGQSDNGESVANGVYYCRVEGDGQVVVRKMVVLR